MIRHFSITILVLLLGAGGLALSQVDNASSTTRTVRSPGEVQVRLSKSVAILWCSCLNYRPRPEWASGNVRVSAVVKRANHEPLNYHYTVSGGRIIGQGPDVIWDFNEGTSPGEYSITIVVDNGLGTFSSSATESITVGEADCHCPCVCPTLLVRSHYSQIKRSGKLDFEARVEGGTAQRIQYRWKVENGVIVTGQGTPSIEVAASSDKNAGVVSAVLEVDLDVDCDCPKVESQSVRVGSQSIPRTFPPSVTWLELDKSTITLDCPQASAPVSERKKPTSKDPVIDVETHVHANSSKDRLDYTYSVSGGRLIGSGESVKWDLTGVDPGTYSITALVNDDRGKSDKETKTVTVAEGDCLHFTACPSISLSTPERVGMTNDFIVRAIVAGGSFDRPQFVWESEDGEIIAGQGSKAVRVRTSSVNAFAPGPLVNFKLDVPFKFSFCNPSSSVHLWIPTPK